jgi:biopolymer transport protein ExbD
MSMNVGSGGGSGDPEVLMDINTTPLIDVMLVLLVMLIITIPIQLHAVNLDMPVGAPPTNDIKPPKIQIDIDENSIVYWQGEAVDAATLDANMATISQEATQPEVHIRPNKASQYAVFANVLSTSKRKGLTKMAVIGSEQFIQ